MAQLAYQSFDIVSVRYCSARVTPRPHDPQQPNRQALYFRALQTVPEVSVILGAFLTSTPTMLRHPPSTPPQFVQVVKTEEKGSDVNLASYLLCDAFDDAFDIAIMLTNDADLVTPIQMVRRKFGKKVFLLCPHARVSFELRSNVDEVRQLRQGVLSAAQFPDTLSDAHGTFSKPLNW